jgi:hypothetical protein
MRKSFLLYIALNLLFALHTIAQVPGSSLFDNSKVHEIKIISLKEGLQDTLEANYVLAYGMNQMKIREIPYTAVKMTIDGTALDSSGIRYKGFNSWWHSVKKPLKLDFNEYKSDQQYDGLKKLNLHNGSGDPSFIRDNINYKLLRLMGIKAPRTAYAKVYFDNTYMGLYRLVEQIDNSFLDINFGDHNGNLYKQESKGTAGYSLAWLGNNKEDYYPSLSLENHATTNDWTDLIHFVDVLNNTRDDQFREAISQVFEVDEFLKVLALDIAVNNMDYYGNSGRNYYLYNHNGKFHWLPWDYNLSWQDGEPPLEVDPEAYPVLIRRILKVPEFQEAFLHNYCQLKTYLSSAFISNLINEEKTIIGSLLENDPKADYPYEAYLKNADEPWDRIAGLKPYAAKRSAELLQVIENNRVDCTVSAETPFPNIELFQLYPQPASDWVNIALSSNRPATVTIVNNGGQVVQKTTLQASGKLNVSSLAPGSYMVRINTEGKSSTKLLLINH